MSLARARAKTIAKFAAAWLALVVVPFIVDTLYGPIVRFARPRFGDDSAFADAIGHVWRAFLVTSTRTWFEGVWIGTIAWTLGFLVRMVARARVRAGAGDFLESTRAWAKRRPFELRSITSLAGLAMSAMIWKTFAGYSWGGLPAAWLIGLAALDGLAIAAWAQVSARALLAPITAESSKTHFEIGADEIVFDAVAVTVETKGAVAALAALTVTVIALLGSHVLDHLHLFHGGMPTPIILGYSGIAAGAALVFRLASRVAVGVDGVHVRGTSRAKFYAYRDLDEARANGSDLELVRRGKVVLRLQLHGEDAARRDAVLARITEHIARVKEGRGATAAQMVASSSKEALARVAHGGADYRMAAMTREQLWALVEGPEIEASARKAAATALAMSSDTGERTRLRVAAEHCAEPHVRIALEEIARGEGDAAEAPLRRAAT